MRTCIVEGCEEAHVARGYCQNHYRVFKRNGTPTPQRERKVYVATGGYLFRAINGETVYEHVTVAERALGRPLPPGAEIHHVNEDPADNRPENLVICPSHEYHMLLHQRMRAMRECGNADWRPCKVCGQHDDPALMGQVKRQFYHRSCIADASRERRANQRSQQ